MTATISVTAADILEMALMAVLIAVVLPFGVAKGRLQEAGRGVAKALVGCALSFGAWGGFQVAGQALDAKIAPKWATPSLSIPLPPVQMPAPPARDSRKGIDI